MPENTRLDADLEIRSRENMVWFFRDILKDIYENNVNYTTLSNSTKRVLKKNMLIETGKKRKYLLTSFAIRHLTLISESARIKTSI